MPRHSSVQGGCCAESNYSVTNNAEISAISGVYFIVIPAETFDLSAIISQEPTYGNTT